MIQPMIEIRRADGTLQMWINPLEIAVCHDNGHGCVITLCGSGKQIELNGTTSEVVHKAAIEAFEKA